MLTSHNDYTFYLPLSLDNDKDGFQWLAKISANTILLLNDSIEFNFQYCRFLSGNLCAVLGSICQGLIDRRNRLTFSEMTPHIKGFLSRNEFLGHYASIYIQDTQNTTIPFRRFEIDDEFAVKDYVEKELLDKTVMPTVSEGLKKEIVKSIFEIYANAITHGSCDYVFSCGQHFPRKNPPEIYFTFVDLGKTIKNSVANFLKKPMSGMDCIDWATSGNNSTKTENHSGGLGLKLIKEFIQLNNGIMQIVSAEGVWELNRGVNMLYEMNCDFPGTIVNLIFNLNDTKSYYLTSEISENSIF